MMRALQGYGLILLTLGFLLAPTGLRAQSVSCPPQPGVELPRPIRIPKSPTRAKPPRGRNAATRSKPLVVRGNPDPNQQVRLTVPRDGSPILPVAKLGPPRKPLTLEQSEWAGSRVKVARVRLTVPEPEED